jgi:hypothetical protein
MHLHSHGGRWMVLGHCPCPPSALWDRARQAVGFYSCIALAPSQCRQKRQQGGFCVGSNVANKRKSGTQAGRCANLLDGDDEIVSR